MSASISWKKSRGNFRLALYSFIVTSLIYIILILIPILRGEPSIIHPDQPIPIIISILAAISLVIMIILYFQIIDSKRNSILALVKNSKERDINKIASLVDIPLEHTRSILIDLIIKNRIQGNIEDFGSQMSDRSEQEHLAQMEERKEKIFQRQEKFKKIIRRSDSLAISELAQLFDMDRVNLLNWLYDLPEEFGFKIEQDVIKFSIEDIDLHIDALMSSFEKMEDTGSGKIKK